MIGWNGQAIYFTPEITEAIKKATDKKQLQKNYWLIGGLLAVGLFFLLRSK